MNKIFVILSCIFLSLFSNSQSYDLKLNSGSFEIEKNLETNFSELNPYRLLIFNEIPTQDDKDKLEDLGVNFLYYLPENIYVASLSNDISNDILIYYGINSVNKLNSQYKIDKKLKQEDFPSWAVLDDKLQIKVLLFSDVIVSDFIERFESLSIVNNINVLSNSITVAIDFNKLDSIACLPFVSYIEPIDPPAEPENKSARTLHRSNTINTDYSNGRKYNGDGVNVMMHDDGYVGPHIDRQGRVDQSFCSGCSSSGSDHGDHVSGTIMGAGNLDPLGRGMADGSFLYVLGYSTNNYYNYVPNLYSNYNVVITSASYSNGCNAGYTSLASDLDLQNNTYPNLIHVFSAGNNGTSDCGYGAGSGWGNVTGGHKQAKNVITVANLTSTSSLASSSSRGPAADGRIKPDISAKGSSVYSTEENQTYGYKTGTSMSCPGISGVLAQLYQAYKDLNGGIDPPSALMKCILLNSADDIGNPGPDFKHGWGQVNSYRAVKMLEDNNFFNSSISQGITNTYSINVPSGVSKVKVMVYWHDKEANTSASISLVNDIDIQLIDPNGQIFNPWVLDPTANSSNLNQNAIRGFDYLNNMEQVTIDNPSSGNYTLNVEGYAIPYGPQEFYVTYEFITDEVELTYPIGGESLVPGEQEYIRWDSYQSGTLTIQYSVDGGSNWNTITNSANSNTKYYSWNVPNYVTDNALIKIISNNGVSSSYSPFTIVDVPTNLSVNWPCPDSIYVSWNPVSGATSYQITMLGQKYMDSIYTTTSTNLWIMNPNPNITNSWFSVSANVNNGLGRRAIAVNAQSINNQCSGFGCTDSSAYNYSPLAIVNDGSCCYVSGCTDLSSINYDSTACFDDGSCIAPILGCTNPLSSNYDPSANTTVAYGGALDNTFGTGGFFNGDQHLIFDANKECIIRSAMIYSEASNTITFELRNSGGNVIDDTTLTVSSGQQRVDLNFNVPVGTDMQIGVSQGALSNIGLYRNNASASYPYNIGSAINITSSSASSAPYGYYYFYYDIEVETPCDMPILPSWDCDAQGNCYDPGTGSGQYSSLTQCQSSCVISVSWDCDGQGNCYDPGTGSGQYSSLTQCQSSCVVPSWDCDGQGNCYDPGTGSGQYSSLTQCQSSCVVPSWDCDGQGNCYDPGTGNGYYSNLATCQENCINTILDNLNFNDIVIFPNPNTGIFNISFGIKQIDECLLNIYNSLGKVIYSNNVKIIGNNFLYSVNINDFADGVYNLEILSNKNVNYYKIILNK